MRDYEHQLFHITKLRILAAAVKPGSIRQIAERSGVPESTVYNHIDPLIRDGYMKVVDKITGDRKGHIVKVYRSLVFHFAVTFRKGKAHMMTNYGTRNVTKIY